MRTLVCAVLMCMALGSYARAAEVSQTLGNSRAIRIEPTAWDLGPEGMVYADVMKRSGYSCAEYMTKTMPTTPQNFLPTFETILESGTYSSLLISSHANRDGWLMIEGYGGDVVGQQAQTQSLQGYTGYYGRIAAVDVADVRYPSGFRVRGVGVNSSYVHDHWVPPTGKVLVDVRACESISLSWAFTNNGLSDMVAFCGNADTVTVRQSIDGITRLYQNLGGVNGVRKRTLANALDGQEWFWSLTGPTNITLAPAVTYCTPITGDLTQRKTITVFFDTKIDWPSAGSYVVMGTDAAHVYNVTPWSDTAMTFALTGVIKNEWGRVNLISSNTFNYGLRGYPAGTALDGNSDAGFFEGAPSGVYPNGDDYTFEFYSKLGDNPAASIVGFTAIADASETKLRWLVESEVNTATYLIETAPDANGPWTTQVSLPARNAPSYTVQWNGTDMWYRLREVETDGDTLTQAYASRQVSEPFVPDIVDTIATAHMQQELQQRYPAMMLVQQAASTVTDVIYTPTSFQDAAQSLAYLKTSWGIPTSVITLPTIGGATGIKSSIASLVQQGARNFLLLGDANATSDVQGHIREGNPATLDSGYVAPGGTTPQPQLNLIPVGSYPMVWGTQELGMTYWTKYFASDWWYIDVDGDGLPDPGLTIGRLPAGTLAEATNAVYKQINAYGINPLNLGVNHVYVHTYAFDALGNSGADAIAYTDSLLTYLPSDRIVDRFTDKPTAWYSEARRDSICIAQFNKGSALQIFKSTVNNRYHDAGCLDQSRRAPLSGIAYNPSRLAFQYISSCGGGDFDRSEVDSVGRPLGERLLENRSDLGTWGYFAPSRGTWQHGNHLMDKEFLTYLYRTGASSVGQAAALSVYRLATTHPEFRDLALSYVFIGDPSVPLAGMKRVTLDAAPWAVGQRLSLAVPQPNPVHGTTVLRLVMPIASQANLSLYDAQGRRVQTIVQGRLEAGQHEYRLSTATWSPGVYFVQLRVNEEQRIQKMVVMR